MKFVGKFVTRATHAGTVRASALNHEIGNDAMKNQSVVETAHFFLSGFFVGEFLSAFRQADKILDCLRRFFFHQLDDDIALRSFKNGVSASRTSHAISLEWVEKLSYTTRWPVASDRDRIQNGPKARFRETELGGPRELFVWAITSHPRFGIARRCLCPRRRRRVGNQE